MMFVFGGLVKGMVLAGVIGAPMRYHDDCRLRRLSPERSTL
jgi:hypothetical protein